MWSCTSFCVIIVIFFVRASRKPLHLIREHNSPLTTYFPNWMDGAQARLTSFSVTLRTDGSGSEGGAPSRNVIFPRTVISSPVPANRKQQNFERTGLRCLYPEQTDPIDATAQNDCFVIQNKGDRKVPSTRNDFGFSPAISVFSQKSQPHSSTKAGTVRSQYLFGRCCCLLQFITTLRSGYLSHLPTPRVSFHENNLYSTKHLALFQFSC